MRHILSSILAYHIAVAPWAAAETALQSHQTILMAIRGFIESNFRHPEEAHEVAIAPLDTRLRLAQCSQPIEVFYPAAQREAGHVSVGVRCQGSQPWSIYHKANIRIFKDVTVLNRAVRQGTILMPSDIGIVRKDLTQVRGAYLNPEQVINKPVKKSLPAGTILNADHLTTPKVIKRGQKVLIRAQSAYFDVSMSGFALTDGELGQRIKVRNEGSKRIVEGTVTAEGVVSIAR